MKDKRILNDIIKCLNESNYKSCKKYVDVDKLVRWLDKAVPEMLRKNDDSVMYIDVGEFERNENTVVVFAMLAWNDGFDYYENNKYISEDGWGLTIGLYEKNSSYHVEDCLMLNDNTEMNDNFDAIARWLLKDFDSLCNGEKLI